MLLWASASWARSSTRVGFSAAKPFRISADRRRNGSPSPPRDAIRLPCLSSERANNSRKAHHRDVRPPVLPRSPRATLARIGFFELGKLSLVNAQVGPTAVEYAVMLGLIVVAAVGIVTNLTTAVSGLYSTISSTIGSGS